MLNSVDAAVAATTSVAWRGAGAAGGERALINLSDNLNAKEQKVSIITGKKILLAGTSGTTPVSVQNLLPVEDPGAGGGHALGRPAASSRSASSRTLIQVR